MITPELVAFIKNALDKGQTKEQITNALLGAGWAQLDIVEAFQNTAPLQPSNPIPPVMAPIQQNPMASPMAIKTMPGTIATNVAVTNKPSGGSGGVGKMILGLILGLLLASAGWWYYFTQMNPVAIEEMPVMEEQMPIPEADPVSVLPTQDPNIVITNTYAWGGKTLTYPSTWTLTEGKYATPAQQAEGQTSVVGISLKLNNSLDLNDEISIGGRQVSCAEFPASQGYTCDEVGPIYTKSTNPEVFVVFEQLKAQLSE